MLILNFSHPHTPTQQEHITAATNQPNARILHIPNHFDDQRPFGPQLDALLAAVELTPAQWQGEPILVVLPSLNFIAALLLAELHGRMGYFPPVVRLRPVADQVPRQFEVAEILDLQRTRDRARQQR
ncbi:MAG: CRISPR-associated protein Csx15 [Caldilineaceae bacterium]